MFSDSPGSPKGEKGEDREKAKKKEKGLDRSHWKPEAGLSPPRKKREGSKDRYFFSGREGRVLDTCVLCQQSCLHLTSLHPHNLGGGYCYYLLWVPLGTSTRRTHKTQIGGPQHWLQLEGCRNRKCNVPTGQPQAFLDSKSLIGDHTASRPILWPTQVNSLGAGK